MSAAYCGGRFLFGFIAAACGALALWIGAVLAFDPFLAFGTRIVPGSVIRPTSRMLGDEQLIKDHLFERSRPETVIIGSSRSVYGLDPRGPALAGEKAFNLSMLGATIADLDGLAAQARRGRDHVRRLIVGVDYFMFFQPEPDAKIKAVVDVRLRRMEEGHGALPIPLAYPQSFLMSTKVGGAIADAVANRRRKDDLGEADSSGLMHGTYRFRVADRSRTFEITLRSLFEQNWYAPPNEALIRARLQRIAGMLRRTCEAGIKVDVILSPEHAMLHEAALLTGQRERREQLRRDMARMMGLMKAELPDCLRYRDASGISQPATEPLRLPPGTAAQFIEVSHFAPIVGERVLMSFLRPDNPISLGFDPAGGDLETDIAATRARLEDWRGANPDDASFVKRIHDAQMPRRVSAATR